MSLKIGDRVDVYRNLRTNNFSVRKQGIVVQHEDYVLLHNPMFIVSQKGRERVLRDKQKNVHAVVRGSYMGGEKLSKDTLRQAYYNPYKTEQFVDKESFKEILESKIAYLENGNVYYR